MEHHGLKLGSVLRSGIIVYPTFDDADPWVIDDIDPPILITWNTASVFNVWGSRGEGTYENTDCFGTPEKLGLHGARVKAHQWMDSETETDDE